MDSEEIINVSSRGISFEVTSSSIVEFFGYNNYAGITFCMLDKTGYKIKSMSSGIGGNSSVVRAKYKKVGEKMIYYFWHCGSYLLAKIQRASSESYIPSYSIIQSESDIPSDAIEATVDLL